MFFLLCKTSNDYFGWTDENDSVVSTYNIGSDGAGYYYYLPQWFIYGTGDFEFVEKIKTRYPKSGFGDNLSFNEKHNKKTNKYYSGTALLISPFFLSAHSLEKLNNNLSDGYSFTYQLFLSIAAVFYWLIGSVAIFQLLLRFKTPFFYATLTIFVISFGTNLSHYVVYAPAYSHVYSFACISFVLYITERWVATDKNKYFYLLGLLLGLSFIIRPTNIIILAFIPFFFENFTSFYTKVKLLLTKNILSTITFFILAGLPLIFHLWNTYLQISELKLNTYTDERFDFLLSPYVFEVLFGIRKGIFIYAPALLLSILGLIYLYKLKRHLFWGFLLVFSVFTYITASWWCWWYGGGFSMRPFVDIIGIFAIPLAFLLTNLKPLLKFVCIVGLFICVGLTQIYSYQISRTILHYDDITTKHFSEVFLQTANRFRWHPFRKFDEVPKEYSTIENSIRFHQYSYPMKEGLVDLSNKKQDDDLSVNVKINSSTEERFAARLHGKYKLIKPDKNPCYKITYYLKDNTKIKNELFFGSKIPSVGSLEYVSIDLYPEINKKNLDSVYIKLNERHKEIYVKDLYLDILKKDE